jgi:NDP-sugar pyrophosphorylase family protein
MKAMIFAAGRGTRLQPLTNSLPKALVPVDGTSMLEIVIRRLINHGFRELIVNVHHFADQIVDFLASKKNFGVRIEISDERAELLDTGGGLKKAAWFFDDHQPFLVHNADTLTNTDLSSFYKHHQRGSALATLLVRHRSGNRFFLFDSAGRLCGLENVFSKERIIPRKTNDLLEQIAFSCLHVIDPKIFELIKEDGCFSITDLYLRLAADHYIAGYVDDDCYWLDIGTPQKLAAANDEIDVKQFIG